MVDNLKPLNNSRNSKKYTIVLILSPICPQLLKNCWLCAELITFLESVLRCQTRPQSAIRKAVNDLSSRSLAMTSGEPNNVYVCYSPRTATARPGGADY